MGVGIGIILTTIIMFSYGNINKKMSDAEIEAAARALGMHYDEDCKSLFEGEE